MECTHPGYIAKDGHLVCASCGAPSPKADFDEHGNLVKKDPVITCPHCGGTLTQSGKAIHGEQGRKMEAKPEDKSLKAHEDKKRKRR